MARMASVARRQSQRDLTKRSDVEPHGGPAVVGRPAPVVAGGVCVGPSGVGPVEAMWLASAAARRVPGRGGRPS